MFSTQQFYSKETRTIAENICEEAFCIKNDAASEVA